MSKGTTNLQPWIEYFKMLQRYIEQGLLQMDSAKHECYVTLSALHAMTPGSDPRQQIDTGAIEQTAARLRTYAAFLCGAKAKDYLSHSFALNVVKDNEPHDPLYTMLLTKKKHWWKKKEKVEIISYGEKV